jgi:hypothetical protein
MLSTLSCAFLSFRNGATRVQGINFGGVDMATVTRTPVVPPTSKLERLVADSLQAFNTAVRAGDFTSFHAILANVWKTETTPKKLQQVFQEFIEKEIDIGLLKDAEPQIAMAAVNESGVLTVSGQYPTESSRVQYELEYANELDSWKLRGISVRVSKGNRAK